MISLIHPSRGRPQKALTTLNNWLSKSSTEIEHILSIDQSDPCKDEYLELFKDSIICLNDNKSVVEATNKAAKESKGDIMIYLSDDFNCPQGWDISLIDIFKSKYTPCLLKVDDCLQKFHSPVLTIPIMNRVLYEKLGYFFNTEYLSMWVDQHLFEICKLNGYITFAPSLLFAHDHWINGKSEIDDTYKNSEKNWKQGEAMFIKHKSEGFK